jgi:hypothetical protein
MRRKAASDGSLDDSDSVSVMPGLDPGIHRKKDRWIAGPGNDAQQPRL